jgi:hypothetical protein
MEAVYSHVVPVLRVAESIVQVLDHLLTRSNVGGWVHRVNGAALGVDVGEGREGTVGKVVVELVGVDKLGHRMLLDVL